MQNVTIMLHCNIPNEDPAKAGQAVGNEGKNGYGKIKSDFFPTFFEIKIFSIVKTITHFSKSDFFPTF